MGTFVFIIVISVLVIVHEWGHFITAKKLGVKVEKFSVGFGPKLFSRIRNGTEFLVSAIPLGGYVKMAGDDRADCKGSADEFYSHPPGHRALIVVMGPVINLVFAYICFYFILTTGFPMLSSKVGKVMEGYPAEAAGILAEDHIVRINDKDVKTWDDLQEGIHSSAGGEVVIDLMRSGKEQRIRIEPRNEMGQTLLGDEQETWIIGVQPKDEVMLMRYGPGESLGRAAQQMKSVVTLTMGALSRVIAGKMDAKEALAGPIRIHDLIRSAATMGIAYIIYIMAVISTSLAMFNLFPVPVLDGGHLLFLAFERVRGRPLPVKIEEGVTKVGFALLMLLMVFVLYNDMVEVGWIKWVQETVQGLIPK